MSCGEGVAVLVAARAALAERREPGGAALGDRADEGVVVVAADGHRDQLGAPAAGRRAAARRRGTGCVKKSLVSRRAAGHVGQPRAGRRGDDVRVVAGGARAQRAASGRAAARPRLRCRSRRARRSAAGAGAACDGVDAPRPRPRRRRRRAGTRGYGGASEGLPVADGGTGSTSAAAPGSRRALAPPQLDPGVPQVGVGHDQVDGRAALGAGGSGLAQRARVTGRSGHIGSGLMAPPPLTLGGARPGAPGSFGRCWVASLRELDHHAVDDQPERRPRGAPRR